MIHSVHKPDSIILRQNIDHRRIDVKGHLILENIVKLAFFVLKNNLSSLVCHLDPSSVGRKRIFFFTAVKHNHIAVSYHVHKNRFHVCHIHLEGAGVYTGDLLLYSPALRLLHFFKIAYKPHAVILNDNPFRLVQNVHGSKTVRSKVFLFFNDLHYCIAHFQNSLVIFHFSLFTENQKSSSLCIKIVLLQGKIQERGFSAFQKACDQINRYCNLVHLFLLICLIIQRSQPVFPHLTWSR